MKTKSSRERRIAWAVGCLLGAVGVKAEYPADAYLMFISTSYSSVFMRRIVGSGDFNGDGREDVAVLEQNSLHGPGFIHLVAGGTFAPNEFVESIQIMKIKVNPFVSNYVFQFEVLFGDLNGDGFSDLLISPLYESGGKIKILWGQRSPPATRDLTTGAADLTIEMDPGVTLTSMGVGDANGDGLKDILIGGRNFMCLVPGRNVFPHSLGVGDPDYVVPIRGGTSPVLDTSVLMADVNGDGRDDLLLSRPKNAFKGRSEAGTLDVILGPTTWPSQWDLSLSESALRIGGAGSGSLLTVVWVADITGDGKAEVLLSSPERMMSGSDLMAAGPEVDLASTSIAMASFSRPTTSIFPPLDFDGDARGDLFYADGLGSAHCVFSHDILAGSSLPSILPEGSMSLRVDAIYDFTTTVATLGDLNGDHRDDLLVPSNSSPSRVDVYYGFFPLENPRVTIAPRSTSMASVKLNFSVMGDPTDMWLSGDLAEEDVGRWRPYVTSLIATLTPTGGPKTVKVKFRNAFGRESDTAQADDVLTILDGGTAPWTNLITDGMSARVEHRMTSPGHLKAVVYAVSGRRVADLLDEEKGAGVWTIVWDGKSAEGNRVGPGIYLMVLESGGKVDRQKILVR